MFNAWCQLYLLYLPYQCCGLVSLQAVKEDCCFGVKELDQMSLREKGCLMYWWYATNTSSICGKNALNYQTA
jgi:hypothetical protein